MPWPIIAGAAIGAGGIIGGGLLNKSAAEQAKELDYKMFKKNIELQKQFAQMGIQWKMADAKKAGIHPLAALGAQTNSFSPIAVGNTPDMSTGNMLSDMGQHVGRAVEATANQRDRQHQNTLNALSLERAGLENQLLRSQITSINRSQVGPALPSNSGMGSLTASGQGDAYVLETPLQRVHSAPGGAHMEVGKVSDVGWSQTPTGLAPVPSQDVKNRIEDQLIPEMAWAKRNLITPFINDKAKPGRELLPKGYSDWQWSPTALEWQPVRGRGHSPWQRWKKFVTGWQK